MVYLQSDRDQSGYIWVGYYPIVWSKIRQLRYFVQNSLGVKVRSCKISKFY